MLYLHDLTVESVKTMFCQFTRFYTWNKKHLDSYVIINTTWMDYRHHVQWPSGPTQNEKVGTLQFIDERGEHIHPPYQYKTLYSVQIVVKEWEL